MDPLAAQRPHLDGVLTRSPAAHVRCPLPPRPAGTHRRTVVGADDGLVYTETGAHPARPGLERGQIDRAKAPRTWTERAHHNLIY
jgi:hypothetical protein